MIDQRALDRAVAEGVIDAGQAIRLAAIVDELAPDAAESAPVRHEAQDAPAPPAPDDSRDPENLRFVRGFADIFVTIGIALVLGPAIYFGGRHLGDTASVAAVIAIGAWALAEYFTRVRMMALPSIALLAVFAAACAVFFGNLIVTVGGEAVSRFPLLGALPLPYRVDASLRDFGLHAALAALATGVAVTLYYMRFRVPIAVAAGVAALLAVVLGIAIIAAPEVTEANPRWLLLLCGVGVFLLAMRFDMSDPGRGTRRTDIAFWLHVLAAPLIVHPVLSGVAARESLEIGVSNAMTVLALFAAIALISVLIDRRSFLVAGLSYAGVAFRSLLGGVGFVESALPGTLLILGAIILLLSAGWPFLRRLLMNFVPAPMALRLPPTRT